ncbi:type I-MYXAN CRISPR-associated endonuclease Cas1 [Spirulina sp. CS-785/01]|uniref:type I-MYXAN CRISPR-associated endonuclease Cas4/Cas1 n=1 Tax=Spirulina sp. CS-785/01 TaxID=3021716 RepID=UPI00232E0699|nr:type I-MYXAN CRISPR-associated endonuclease Cas1 [Spirulina sp. CS-785/01]MDB9311777.1 type I-MYXAN CRISPR-associated endonuclease Cas1 [Spirulina sp. CS-785/01]
MQQTIRVSALHAFAYCPRLFYLEEVEELYTQDAAVFAGRRLHAEIERNEEEDWEDLYLENETLGLRGRVDALRTREGQLIPYEHKRGRCYRDEQKQAQAWESDKLQVLAYCCLIEAALGTPVAEGRIRYHADNVVVHIPLDDSGRDWVHQTIAAAGMLRHSAYRPPVTENEQLCQRCSLAPVCLPEEARLAHHKEVSSLRLFPSDDERQIIHVLEPGSRLGRTGERLKLTRRDRTPEIFPTQQVGQVVLHSFSQISTQALHFCASQGIGVHWISGGGRYVGSFEQRRGSIQRRRWQYKALANPEACLTLAQTLVAGRGRGQRQFLMRGKRNLKGKVAHLETTIAQMKAILKQVPDASSLETLLGLEGKLAALYFGALPHIISSQVPPELQFNHRNRRPPKDRFNAMLGFGYALLLKDVMNAILTVGLEPALGFYHQPRSQAPPLALDLMELFRVPLVDMPILASIHRGQWDVEADFTIRGEQVWLSDLGRHKFVELYEQRKAQTWKHPKLGYSLTYRRFLELEVRLLEKEWCAEGGLFGQWVVR